MKDVIELAEWWLRQFLDYLNCYVDVLLRPKDIAKYKSMSLASFVVYSLLTAIIIVPFDFLISEKTPPLIETPDTWLVNLPTLSDRVQWSSGEHLFDILNILDWTYFVILIAAATTVTAKIICWTKFDKVGWSNSIRAVLPVTMVSIVSTAILAYLLFRIAITEVIPNIVFTLLFIVITSAYFYCAFVIIVKAYKSLFGIGTIRALAIMFLAVLVVLAMLFLNTPVGFYRLAQQPEKGLARTSALIEEAINSKEAEDYNSAQNLANEALKMSPNNLHAEIVILSALLGSLSNADETKMESSKKSLADRLGKFTETYPDMPSAQLLAGSFYALIDECSRSKIAYKSALDHPNSLPHEKIRAMIALNGLEKIEVDQAIEVYKDSIWIPNRSLSSRLMVLLRSVVATWEPVGFQLMLEDAVSGSEERSSHSVYPFINIKSDFFDFEIASLCGYTQVIEAQNPI